VRDPLGLLAGILILTALGLAALGARTPPGATYETVDLERVRTRHALFVCALVCLVGGVWTLVVRAG